MNLYELVNSIESEHFIIDSGFGSLTFEKEDVHDSENRVVVSGGGIGGPVFNVWKTVKFVSCEEDEEFIYFKAVGQAGELALRKKNLQKEK